MDSHGGAPGAAARAKEETHPGNSLDTLHEAHARDVPRRERVRARDGVR